MSTSERSMECDLLVVGSGASGFAAAATAAWHGLRVVLVEKDSTFGGATAWSGGWIWAPGNHLAVQSGIYEDPEQPRTYLRHALGERYDAARLEAFLTHAPHMVRFFDAHTALQFAEGNSIPDMHGHLPGAATGGHQVAAAPLDGRELGSLLKRLRTTMRETSFLGMPIMAGADLGAFLTATRSWRSFVHVARRVTRHVVDLVVHGRALQLVNGVALIGRLAKSAEQLGVTLMTSTSAQRLFVDQGRVTGAWVQTPQGGVSIHASHGVVLATGGFPHDIERRKRHFPRTPTGVEHLALPPESCAGDGITLGESVGGQLEIQLASPVAWAPVSRVRHSDGAIGHFPHIIDRGKPGVIGVLANGCRFANEADGYYDYTAAMVAAVPEGQEVASWLICDHRFLRRYGLGIAKPFPVPIAHHIRSGYLVRSASIGELAQRCGIDQHRLEKTVHEFNLHAKEGVDPEFGRGATAYNRKGGDPMHRPNPCVAPIEHGPFYAVKVQPGSFATFAGLKTNASAQVLGRDDQPISGLYAVGADMAHVMGGLYPSGGINLGPAMTFGYIAARHAAGKSAFEFDENPPQDSH